MSVRRLAVVPAAACALALTACGSDSAESGSSSAEDSPSASPSPTAPALARKVMAQPPQRPKDERTPAGAERFAGYVVETLWYGLQQRDLSQLWSLVHEEDTCDSCHQVESAVEKGVEQGKWQLLTKPVDVKGARVLDRSSWVVGVGFDRPRIKQYDENGEVVRTYPASDEFIEMGVQWRGGEWTLYDFRYAED